MPRSRPLKPFKMTLSFAHPPVIHQAMSLPSRYLIQFIPIVIQECKRGCWINPRHNRTYRPIQLQSCPMNLRLVCQLKGCDYQTSYRIHLWGCTPRRLPQQLRILNAVPDFMHELQYHLSLSTRGPNYSNPSWSHLPKLPNGTSWRIY